ncbi:MAG: RNAase P [Thermoplasmata archaeon]|nr:RNAase P [Thermoplasmata archaeon]
MGKHQRIRRKKEARSIARERIAILYSLAEEAALQGEETRAKRYISLLRKIGMRYNVSIPKKHKVTTCRRCNAFLISGKTAKIRLDKKKLIVECLGCGYVRRFPYTERTKTDRGRGVDGRGGSRANEEGGKSSDQRGN